MLSPKMLSRAASAELSAIIATLGGEAPKTWRKSAYDDDWDVDHEYDYYQEEISWRVVPTGEVLRCSVTTYEKDRDEVDFVVDVDIVGRLSEPIRPFLPMGAGCAIGWDYDSDSSGYFYIWGLRSEVLEWQKQLIVELQVVVEAEEKGGY